MPIYGTSFALPRETRWSSRVRAISRSAFICITLLALAASSQGCFLAVSGGSRAPHRAPHPPRPQPLTRQEIANLAIGIAHERGYRDLHIDEMEREDDYSWEIEIRGWVGSRRAELELVVDGWDGHVLDVEDKRDHGRHRGRGHHRDHGHD